MDYFIEISLEDRLTINPCTHVYPLHRTHHQVFLSYFLEVYFNFSFMVIVVCEFIFTKIGMERKITDSSKHLSEILP